MIARIIFPGSPAVFTDIAQVLVALETFGFGVTMLPDTGILTWWDQHFSCGSMFVDTFVNTPFVATSVCRQTVDRLFDLCEHRFSHGISLIPASVRAAASISPLLRSMLRWSFRQVRRFDLPCVRTFHSP